MNVDNFKMRLEKYMTSVWEDCTGKRGRGCDPAHLADAAKIDLSALSKASLLYAIGLDIDTNFPKKHGKEKELAEIEEQIMSAGEMEDMENAFNKLLVMKKRLVG